MRFRFRTCDGQLPLQAQAYFGKQAALPAAQGIISGLIPVKSYRTSNFVGVTELVYRDSAALSLRSLNGSNHKAAPGRWPAPDCMTN